LKKYKTLAQTREHHHSDIHVQPAKGGDPMSIEIFVRLEDFGENWGLTGQSSFFL